MLAFLLFSVCFCRLIAFYKKLPQLHSYRRQSSNLSQYLVQNRVILRKSRTNIHCPIVFGTYHFDLAKLVGQDIKIEDEFKNGLGGMDYYEMSFCGDTPTACVGVTGATFGGLVKRDLYGNCIGNYGSWDGDWQVGSLRGDHLKGMLSPMGNSPGINPNGFSITIKNGQVCDFTGHRHSRTEFNFVCDEGSDLATGTIAVFSLDDCLHVVLVPTKGACTDDGMPMRGIPGVMPGGTPGGMDPYSNFGGGFLDGDNWENELIVDNTYNKVPAANFYPHGGFSPSAGISGGYSNGGGNSYSPANPNINAGGSFNSNGIKSSSNGAGVNSNNGNRVFNNGFSNNNGNDGFNGNNGGGHNAAFNGGGNQNSGGNEFNNNQNGGSGNRFNNSGGSNSNNNVGNSGTNNNSQNSNSNGNSSGSQKSTSGTTFTGTYSGDATCTHTPVPTCHGNVSRMKAQLSIQDCDHIEILINTGNAMYTGNAHGSHCTKTDISFDFTVKVVLSEISGSMYLHKYKDNLQGQLDIAPFDSSSWRLELSLLDLNRVLKWTT